jgi:hypothetical protein
VPVDAAVQQEAEPVVDEVSIAVADPLDLLYQGVDRFGGPVGQAAGVEVGEQFGTPGVEGSGEAVQFRDVRVGAVDEPAVQVMFGGVAVTAGVEPAQVLRGDPGSDQSAGPRRQARAQSRSASAPVRIAGRRGGARVIGCG